MPENYYTIGEVLALLLEEFPDITISKIRFLESQGLITPERSSSGYRKFTKSEIERLRFILREQKEHFLPLRVIRDRLEGESSDGVLRPEDVTDPSMPRGIRVPSAGHPTNRAGSERSATSSTARSAAKSRILRFTKAEVIESTGVSSEMLAELEKMKFVKAQTLGREQFYDEIDRDIVHLAGRLASLGVQPRVLMSWRLAAEREADVFEPLVRMSHASQLASGSDAQRLLDDLVSLGEELRTALLRSVTRQLRDEI